jgi:hypothetical protein
LIDKWRKKLNFGEEEKGKTGLQSETLMLSSSRSAASQKSGTTNRFEPPKTPTKTPIYPTLKIPPSRETTLSRVLEESQEFENGIRNAELTLESLKHKYIGQDSIRSQKQNAMQRLSVRPSTTTFIRPKEEPQEDEILKFLFKKRAQLVAEIEETKQKLERLYDM